MEKIINKLPVLNTIELKFNIKLTVLIVELNQKNVKLNY